VLTTADATAAAREAVFDDDDSGALVEEGAEA